MRLVPASEGQPFRLLSHYPLLPPFPWPQNWEVSFYIDATTRQVFNDYAAADTTSTAARQALATMNVRECHELLEDVRVFDAAFTVRLRQERG